MDSEKKNKKKQIAILGSTGSIGTQALQVIEEHPDLYEAYALTANNRVELLIAQARKFQPEVVVIANEEKYAQLKEALSDLPIKVYAGIDAVCQIVEAGPVDMVLTMAPGEPATLTVTDGTHRVEVAGEVPQTALTRPTDEELARRALEKCGGTPFYLQNLTCHIEEGLMLPLSALNRLRAAALTALAEARSVVVPYPQAPAAAGEPAGRARPTGAPRLGCRLAAAAQMTPAIRRGGGRLSLPLHELAERPELLETGAERWVAELPAFCAPQQEEAVMRALRKLKEQGLTAALCGNLGSLLMAREAGLRIIGDYGLNIINSPAAQQAAALGCDEITLSFECERNAARNIHSPVPIGVIAYGRLPLMLLRNCPGKTAAGCGDCRGINHITDRRGEDFPLQCQNRQYTHLLNPRPLFLSDRLPEWDFCDFLTLRFTTETPAECDEVLKMYQTGAAPAGSFTRGLYYRTLK